MGPVEGVSLEERQAAVARLRQTIDESEYSYAELADLCGVSEKTMRRWTQTTNTTAPSVRQVMRLSIYLDMSPTWMIFGFGAPKLSDVRKLANIAQYALSLEESLVSAAEAGKALQGALIVPEDP